MSKHKEIGVTTRNSRVLSVIREIERLMPSILKDCVDLEEDNLTSNDFYMKLGDYSDKITKSMKDNFWWVSDVQDLFEWFMLSTEWIKQTPYIGERFYSFMNLFESRGDAWNIIDKITCDFEVIKEKQ